MVTPGKLAINIYAGASFDLQVTLVHRADEDTPWDLTGYTGKAQVRSGPGKALVLELDFELTDAANGEFKLSATAVETAALTAGKYLWDLILTDGDGKVYRVFEGAANVLARITV